LWFELNGSYASGKNTEFIGLFHAD